ncbi:MULTISPECIES: MarR family transcriptional regulator [Vagococcus]|uniref:Transcriptional regulator, MarR family n=1 Tax=Vagococcus fluvialis bH819 TaxID=1255619 RepID=A0A1X6WQ54_9ENTE|nr:MULTISPECIES: MarR family transcriptional regulator [Vagococcus]SLM86372.1 transcriptional regulator, MarR family [Vagococcus fluvialis bH819]HCM89026.1 transcriptional regulator [Vagococcus sp.]
MDLRQLSKLLYQLKLANQEMTTKFEQETGFSITRYELMMFLKEIEECSQTVLQNELKIDSAAITRHLKVLEEKQYVTRERNKQNNREILVKITNKALEDLKVCEHSHGNGVDVSLSEQEADLLLALLMKLVK